MEIERKYKIECLNDLPENYRAFPCHAIEQAYLLSLIHISNMNSQRIRAQASRRNGPATGRPTSTNTQPRQQTTHKEVKP